MLGATEKEEEQREVSKGPNGGPGQRRQGWEWETPGPPAQELSGPAWEVVS